MYSGLVNADLRERERRQNWSTNSVAHKWNWLSSQVVSATIIDGFKKRLDKFMDDDDEKWYCFRQAKGALLQTPCVLMFLSLRSYVWDLDEISASLEVVSCEIALQYIFLCLISIIYLIL